MMCVWLRYCYGENYSKGSKRNICCLQWVIGLARFGRSMNRCSGEYELERRLFVQGCRKFGVVRYAGTR